MEAVAEVGYFESRSDVGRAEAPHVSEAVRMLPLNMLEPVCYPCQPDIVTMAVSGAPERVGDYGIVRDAPAELDRIVAGVHP